MSDSKKVKLVAIYMYISELYEKELQYTCQRFSNNSTPEFTDAERSMWGGILMLRCCCRWECRLKQCLNY